jgi:hypothetical protein
MIMTTSDTKPFVIDPNRPELYEVRVNTGTKYTPVLAIRPSEFEADCWIVVGHNAIWAVRSDGMSPGGDGPLIRLRQPATAPDTTTIARQHWEDCCAQGKHLHGYYAEAAIDEPEKAIETVKMFDADHPASKLLLLPADEFLATALRWRDQLVMDMNDLADDWMLTRPDPDEPAADLADEDHDPRRDGVRGGSAADAANVL